MVELVHIFKKYNERVILNDINYTFTNTGIYHIKGENGSGKTTLLKIISGRITYEGKIKCSDQFFFLPFNEYLIEEFSVREMILLEKEICKEFKEYKNNLNIEELIDKKISKLSLGEKQRVGVYLAICSNYKTVLLDEPLSGLDKYYKKEVINLIKRQSKKRLFIIVSHDVCISKEEVILEIKNGKLIGAVTHVLVDDPTKGYAIFAENMLENAQSICNQQLKDAS